jgi:hypothetical protein
LVTAASVKAQDRGGVRLVAVPEAIALTYNPPSPNYVFYVGDSVDVAVRLINHTEQELSLPAGRTLEQQITKVVRPSLQQKAAADALWLRDDIARHPFDGTSSIPPNNYAEIRWSLSSSASGTLAPGIYEVNVSFPLRPGHELTDRKTVEVRVPSSRADQMDSLLHKAIRARFDNRLRESQQLLNTLLGMSPQSSAAYTQLGSVFVAAGDCAAARDAFDKAIAIVQAGSDRENFSFGHPAMLRELEPGLRLAKRSCM